jgi:hypothetical protein
MRVVMSHKSSSQKRTNAYIVATALAVGSLGVLRALVRKPGGASNSRKRARTITLSDACLKCSDDEISVLTLNTLAPNLVSRQRYKYVPGHCLPWQYRFDRLQKLLKKVRSVHERPEHI